MEYFAYVLIAMIAGTCGGLLGISGGVITVPLLALTFELLGFPEESQMHMAIGTSLASMIFNSTASVLVHNKKKSILWKTVGNTLPGIASGAILGAFTAYLLPGRVLEIFFGIFLFVLGVYFLKRKDAPIEDHKIPKTYLLILLGTVVGYLSNILGIGGGIFLMPLFLFFRFSFIRALGTSVTIGLFSSIIGASSYLYFGMQAGNQVPMALGYLYLPAFFVISVVSATFAFISTKFAHRISQKTLYKLFAFILMITSVTMFLNT